jgi:hypothetical protein
MEETATGVKSRLPSDVDEAIESKSQFQESADAGRRGPGRPRKYPERKPSPRNGIVKFPMESSNHIEFIYNNPFLFKKIWGYFHTMAVEKIHMVFKKESILIWCQDHHHHTRMKVEINCHKMNHYFCKTEMDIGILSGNMEAIMRTIDKTYSSIYFTITEQNYQKFLEVSLIHENDIEDKYTVQLIGEYSDFGNTSQFDAEEEYTIRFELPAKDFKKKIADIKTLSSYIAIRKDSIEDPLTIDYTSGDKQIKTVTVFPNNKDINIKSKLGQGDSFHIHVSLDFLKPISSSLLSDTIVLYAHESKPLLFVANMDTGAIIVKVLTDIIDDRS